MKKEKYMDIVNRCVFFRHMSREYLSDFLDSVSASERTLSRNENLFVEGDCFPFMCILLDGEIILSRCDEYGNRNVIDMVRKGDVFAESFSFTDEKISPVTATSVGDSLILMISSNKLVGMDEGESRQAIIEKYTVLSKILSTFAEKNLTLMSKIDVMSRRNTREKILHYLEMNRVEKGSDIFSIPFSRQEMADFIGVDRSALSRELSRLRDENIIDFEKNTFRIK